jgi:hypothetical protein
MEKETEDRLAAPTLEQRSQTVQSGQSPRPRRLEQDERLRHALMLLDEARRTVVRALNELARAEHERLEDRNEP